MIITTIFLLIDWGEKIYSGTWGPDISSVSYENLDAWIIAFVIYGVPIYGMLVLVIGFLRCSRKDKNLPE